MLLQVIEGKFSVCKVENLRAVNFHVPWLFVGKTDAEISVVCLISGCSPPRWRGEGMATARGARGRADGFLA